MAQQLSRTMANICSGKNLLATCLHLQHISSLGAVSFLNVTLKGLSLKESTRWKGWEKHTCASRSTRCALDEHLTLPLLTSPCQGLDI